MYDNKIELWRNTIQLFHKYNRPKFIGPFYQFNDRYVVEVKITDKQGNEREPDIISSGKYGWLVIELTTNDSSKKNQLDSDENIEPRHLGVYGLTIHDSGPDVISSRLKFVEDGNHCQLIVDKELDVKKVEFIQCEELKNSLVKYNGISLNRLPEIPIALLPELKGDEIRIGLTDIVMQLFDPESDGKTLNQMVDEGLDRISEVVGTSARRGLNVKVKNALEELYKKYLPNYLEFKDGKYRSTGKYKGHFQTRIRIATKLSEWSGQTKTLPLEDFNGEKSKPRI